MTCEALLTGKWLSANIGSLVDAFNAEPAAFVFVVRSRLFHPSFEETGRTGRFEPTTRHQAKEGRRRHL